MNKRHIGNQLLQSLVDLYLSIYPEIRFTQVLWNLGIIMAVEYKEGELIPVDNYYEEPYDIAKRILPEIEDLITDKFPENPTIVQRLRRINILEYLKELKLTDDGNKEYSINS